MTIDSGDASTVRWINEKVQKEMESVKKSFDANSLEAAMDELLGLKVVVSDLLDDITTLNTAIESRFKEISKMPQRVEVFYERRRKSTDAREVEYVVGVRKWLKDVPEKKQVPYEDPEYLQNYLPTGDALPGYLKAKKLAKELGVEQVTLKGWGKLHTKMFEKINEGMSPKDAKLVQKPILQSRKARQ
jgi:hypothetical protein